jgi:uncharacterized protein
MKLQDVRFAGERLIEAYGDNGFRFTDGRRDGSILILPSGIEAFPCAQFELLAEEMLDPVLAAAADIEILLLGTGTRQRFPSPSLRRKLLERGIGLEVMDTGAACRTYNVLVTESRRVAAALIAV